MGSSTGIDNLYPALTECFVLILCGYMAGRTNLITETESKGFNTFVGTFALPALIFKSLVEIQLGHVNWYFLLSIFLSKGMVFVTVIVISILIARPLNLGRAGLFGIFCTMSNDFAIGFPIVQALYKDTHPEYPSYLYLVAPVSLAILNPLAFILMEIHKRRIEASVETLLRPTNDDIVQLIDTRSGRLRSAIAITRSIIFNPIIMMTFLGLIGNLIFEQKLPPYLGEVLNALGQAFPASALFLLGLRMVGKVHKLRGATLVIPGILIMVKLIALPLITRETIDLIHAGNNSSETESLSTYGFLYGTFPSAPTVFVFATLYNIDVDLIASAMVACTFISAPLMFISAKMISLTHCDPSEYMPQLNSYLFDISIVAIISSLWVLFVFIFTGKIKRLPHRITAFLIISQFLSCIGAILWYTLESRVGFMSIIQFSIFTIGVYSSRIWTAILACNLLFLQCRSLCYVLKLQPFFILIGWGFPVLITILILVFDRDNIPADNQKNPNFVYGAAQALFAVSLLVLCFIVTLGCLILHQRYRRLHHQYWDASREISEPSVNDLNTESPIPGTSSDSGISPGRNRTGLPTINEGYNEESPSVDIEDLFGQVRIDDDGIPKPNGTLCPSNYSCDGQKRRSCRNIVAQYEQTIDDDLEIIEEEPEALDPQIHRHIVLLILLLCSMFVGLALSIWTLVMDQPTGIYVELSFLDATLNFGQSIMVFAIFGLDTKEYILPLLKLWRKCWYGANKLVLPSWHELSPETRHICDQFVAYHLQRCKDTIAGDKRWRLKIYRNVFTGEQLVDWLIEVGLAHDRTDAVNYARHLIEGRVLRHINGVYHFYDRHILYTFD